MSLEMYTENGESGFEAIVFDHMLLQSGVCLANFYRLNAIIFTSNTSYS